MLDGPSGTASPLKVQEGRDNHPTPPRLCRAKTPSGCGECRRARLGVVTRQVFFWWWAGARFPALTLIAQTQLRHHTDPLTLSVLQLPPDETLGRWRAQRHRNFLPSMETYKTQDCLLVSNKKEQRYLPLWWASGGDGMLLCRGVSHGDASSISVTPHRRCARPHPIPSTAWAADPP